MNAIPWLVFGTACAVLIIWGFVEKAKARKREDRESEESRHRTA